MSYNLSGGGIPRLKRLERANGLERFARMLRSEANKNSTEHRWVNDNYKKAREYEAEAKFLRRKR